MNMGGMGMQSGMGMGGMGMHGGMGMGGMGMHGGMGGMGMQNPYMVNPCRWPCSCGFCG